ncbi:MAG: glycolate oxidase subunit GlcE [Burkholderiales bacterium RIFCSPLOWO2_02_FULL_57_36]|nr:MAG: glycolate oxidase subunit GlcE [Burkholderiales bacterium RIFCSPLOWO2_02_FULL_57_36]
MEQTLQTFSDRIIAAVADKTALRIRGGGTKDWYGQALQGEVLDTSGHTGILAYDPTELVITARSGTPLAEIDAALAAQNQMLAFEPPYFDAQATIGGVVAAGLSGPRRQAVGALRDFVLGVVLMDGKGDVLRFGGQVMKNVAGYDVSRLLAGSMGTLGLILEVSLKVLPRPFAETSLRFELNESDAIRRLNEWGSQPLPISASSWHGGSLMVRLSGAQAAIHAAPKKMGGDQVPDAEAFWTDLREQRNRFFCSVDKTAETVWRLSVPSIAPPLALRGEQLIEWGGAQRWLKTNEDAAVVRAAIDRIGGHATLFRGGDKRVGVFHPLAPAIAAIHRNLKRAFDPSGIFNPGRMYSEW